jgi:hypothetical protein
MSVTPTENNLEILLVGIFQIFQSEGIATA